MGSLFAASRPHDKMASTLIYGRILQKSSPEPVDRFPQDLALSIGDSGPS